LVDRKEPNDRESYRGKQGNDAGCKKGKDEATFLLWKFNFPQHDQRSYYQEYIGREIQDHGGQPSDDTPTGLLEATFALEI